MGVPHVETVSPGLWVTRDGLVCRRWRRRWVARVAAFTFGVIFTVAAVFGLSSIMVSSARADVPTAPPAPSIVVAPNIGAASPAAPAAQNSRGWTRTNCVHGLKAGETIALRAAPGGDASVVDRLPAGACGLATTGACVGDWCPMMAGDKAGWIDTRFVAVYELPPGHVGALSSTSPGGARETRDGGGAGSAPRAPFRASVAQAVPEAAPAVRRPVAPPEAERGARRPEPRETAAVGKAPRGACVVGVMRGDTLRIRSGPGIDHREIGGIPPGDCRVAPAGACRGAWCRIAWRGQTGWVNSSYLD